MTDKVQKIREEVERLQNELIQEKKKGFGSDVDDACILELQNVLTFIDSLQEEPVSEDLDLGCGVIWKGEEPVSEDFEKKFISFVNATHDNNGSYSLHDFAQRLYNIAKEELKEPISKDFEKIVEEIAEPTILNAYGTKELARRLCNTIYDTSVSEDLEEASKEWLSPQLDKSYAYYGEAKMMELTHFDGYAMLDAIEFGAKWQKQLMMKNAVECDVIRKDDGLADLRWKDENGLKKLTSNLNNGDKVKIITVKKESKV